MQKIEIADEMTHITCPSCGECEANGIDDKRKFNTLIILSWADDKPNTNEVSHHFCCECEAQFKVEWDYSNEINE